MNTPGITPPYVIQANASNVPVAQLTLSSRSMSEQEIADYGQNFIRLRLFTIPATLARHGRRVILHIKATAPWADVVVTGHGRLLELAAPT